MLESRLMPLATSWAAHLSLQLLEAESILWQQRGLLGAFKAGRAVILQHRLEELHRQRRIHSMYDTKAQLAAGKRGVPQHKAHSCTDSMRPPSSTSW